MWGRSMLKFKSFVKISEELTPNQKQIVSKWPRDPNALKHSDHFFGEGNDDKIEPLQGGVQKSEPHRAVERHLGQEISLEDYKSGRTSDKYGRQVKIGGLLQKTKASPRLINQFANDNTRQLKSQNRLSVHVTRSAAGVAGQTSGEQSWTKQSCKNFETGSNRRYLKPEVKNGTVVAYLKNEKGEELARQTFHPYHSKDGKVIYRRNGYYGPRHAEFEAHMEDLEKRLSDQHEPSLKIYKIHKDVYNDTGVKETLHPSVNISKTLDSKSSKERSFAAGHFNANSEDITKALNDKNSRVRQAAITNPNVTQEHITQALKDKDPAVRVAAFKNPKVTAEHITKGLNDEDESVRHAAARHRNATSEHVSKALKDESPNVRRAALLNNRNVTSEQITEALKDKDDTVRRIAISHPKATAEHITQSLNDKDYAVRLQAIQQHKVTPEHITKALNDENPHVRSAAVTHPNATAEHIAQATKDPDPGVRFDALKNPKATMDQLKQGLKDQNERVRSLSAQTIEKLNNKG